MGIGTPKNNIALRCCFFIQAAGLVYHPPSGGISSKTAKPFLYLITPKVCISFPAAWWYAKLRFDDIQFLSELMIYKQHLWSSAPPHTSRNHRVRKGKFHTRCWPFPALWTAQRSHQLWRRSSERQRSEAHRRKSFRRDKIKSAFALFSSQNPKKIIAVNLYKAQK